MKALNFDINNQSQVQPGVYDTQANAFSVAMQNIAGQDNVF